MVSLNHRGTRAAVTVIALAYFSVLPSSGFLSAAPSARTSLKLCPNLSSIDHQHEHSGTRNFASNNNGRSQPRPLQELEDVLDDMSVNTSARSTIPALLLSAGFEDSSELVLFASDFVENCRPEVLSKVLQDDFGFNAYQSHLCRAALFDLVRTVRGDDSGTEAVPSDNTGSGAATREQSSAVEVANDETSAVGVAQQKQKPKVIFKDAIVNQKAKRRRQSRDNAYGLPKDHTDLLPTVAKEMEEFMEYMTRPSASAQESPIREATAEVYLRHARLFLGWYLKEGGSNDDLDMDAVREAVKTEYVNQDVSKIRKEFSLHKIIANKEAISAQPIVDFILWLRKTREISDSYEANLLRGLTKMLKYRFRDESNADPTYGDKAFDDIAAVRELRKLHRDANKRQAKSPRSSEEDRKWLSWSEYLGVVEALRLDVIGELNSLQKKVAKGKSPDAMKKAAGKRIAIKFQKYLILAFFSCVPDRQRTVRELELDRTFIRNDQDNTWAVKHSPDDYKTGGTYGDRPPLGLSPELSQDVDDYLEHWRAYLNPTSQHVFVQSRSGKPMNRDAVYNVVARSCYEHTGKKTNPHLLRDMIVTHVRDSPDASERDLEALALFMGHSVNMQRTSYDRRTLDQKVAPAVELLKNVNKGSKK